MEGRKRRLGDILTEMNLIAEADLKKALDLGREKGLRLGAALIELGMLTEDQILWALAEQMGLSFIRVTEEQVAPEVVRLVPEEMSRRHGVLPLIRIGNELTLAVNDPLEDALFADIARLISGEVRICLAKAADITRALDRVYGTAVTSKEVWAEMSSPRYGKEELGAFAADRGGVRLLTRLVADGLAENVDKIHVDVKPSEAVVRFRKDRSLDQVLTMSPEAGRALLTRLAIQGRTAASEAGKPWRVELALPDQQAVLDVHTQKVRGGEIATLRILGKRAKELSLAKLGLTAAQRGAVEAILASPGVVVVTGPSDSGRATTVISLLARFDSQSHRIVTAEDWVRTEHPGYAQIQREAGGPGLAHLLALDADVVYVESLRSKEEIEAVWRSGMAGTFIFTLMGFRRAASALAYLADQGIQPALIAEGLSGIMAEQLPRKLCEKCKVKIKLKKSMLEGLGPEVKEALTRGNVYKAKGCKACGGHGFVGREAVFEVLAMDQELRAAIAAGVSESDLPLIAKKIGESLPDRVLEKIKSGACEWTEILAFR